MHVRAWNNGAHHRIRRRIRAEDRVEDRDSIFEPAWTDIVLTIPGEGEVTAGRPVAHVRTVIRSPGRLKMLRISDGSSPVLPNQCGTWVLNSATSPGPSTQSWSPTTRCRWPDRT